MDRRLPGWAGLRRRRPRAGLHAAGPRVPDLAGVARGVLGRYLVVHADVALARGDLGAAEAHLREAVDFARRTAGWPAPLVALHSLGVVAVRQGRPARGVRLIAAVHARVADPGPATLLPRRLWRGGASPGVARSEPGEAGLARMQADRFEARAALAPDAYAAAWAAGEAMSVDEAIAYALEHGDGSE
jgi:hypothetical protein